MNHQEYIEQFGSLSTWDAYRAGVESAAQVVDQQVEVYPESVFIPPPAGQHGKTVDACSAAALRAVLPVVARKIRQLADPEEESHCAICSWPIGTHAHDCPLYSWHCGVCGSLVNKRTEGDHARSHAALPISTSNVCLCGDWPKQSKWLHCPWCGCTLSAANPPCLTLVDHDQLGICEYGGCERKAARYIMLESGAVYLCRKHAAEQLHQADADPALAVESSEDNQ